MRSNSEGITPIVPARSIVAVAIGLIIALGCGPSPANVVGHWQGRLPLPEGANVPDDIRNTAERINLILKQDGKFDLVRIGLPILGEYQVNGQKVTLIPKTVMNRPLEDLGPGMRELGDPMTLTFRENKLTSNFGGPTEATLSRIADSR